LGVRVVSLAVMLVALSVVSLAHAGDTTLVDEAEGQVASLALLSEFLDDHRPDDGPSEFCGAERIGFDVILDKDGNVVKTETISTLKVELSKVHYFAKKLPINSGIKVKFCDIDGKRVVLELGLVFHNYAGGAHFWSAHILRTEVRRKKKGSSKQ